VEADAEPHVVSAAEDVEEPVVSQAVSARDNTVGVPQSQKQAMGVLVNPVSAPAIKGFIPGDNAFSGAALYDPGNPTLDGALKPGTSVRAVEGLSGFIDGDKYYDVYASGDVVDGILQVDHYVVRSNDNNRNEWVVGPDHLDKFTQNTTSHAVIAGNHFGISGIPDEYAAGANLAITKLNRGDASGAFAALGDGVINSWSNPDNVMAGVAGLAGAGVVARGVRGVPNKINMRSADDLMGVEPAPQELISAVSKKRDVVIAQPGSEELRMLDYFGAEASVGGINNTHILLRENPSKAAVFEEFLHGTQAKLGITDRLGTSGLGSAETHVKDFMINHQKMLGLSDEDVQILQILRDKGL